MNLIAICNGVARGVGDWKWRAAFKRISNQLAVDQPITVGAL
jgi:hypothetical protein